MIESTLNTMLEDYRRLLSEARAKDMGNASCEAEKQLIGYLYDEALAGTRISDCVSCKAKAFIHYGQEIKARYSWLLFALLGFTVVFIALDLRFIALCLAVAAIAFYAYMVALKKKNAPEATATAELTVLPAEFIGFTQNRLANLTRQSSAIHDLLEQQKDEDALHSIAGLPELYAFLYEESSFNDSDKYAVRLCEGLLHANDLEPVLEPERFPTLFLPVVSDCRTGVVRPAIRRISSGETVMTGERFVRPEEDTP